MEIIAEIGQNHNGDMNLACELIHAAYECGADAAKFQLYHAPSLFPKYEWFDYNCQTELSRDQLALLAQECRKVGIEFFASAFDVERVGWLEEIGVKRHKLASRSIKEPALIDAVVKTGKPILASLGMWNSPGLPVFGSPGQVSFLYCISKYPTDLHDLKLRSVDFENTFAGFSDHTLGITACLVAFSRGARIIEKHFTLDKKMYGPDHSCSMTPEELSEICRYRNEITQCL